MSWTNRTADLLSSTTGNDESSHLRRTVITATLTLLIIGSGFIGTAAAHDHGLDAEDLPGKDYYVGIHIDWWERNGVNLDNYGYAYGLADFILDTYPKLDRCRSRVSVANEIWGHALANEHTAGITCQAPY